MGGELRTIAGVIGTFLSLVLILSVGNIVIGSVVNALPTDDLSPAWANLLTAASTMSSISLNISIFILAIIMTVPLYWAFFGNRSGRNDW